MELKPELKAVLDQLTITPEELVMLQERMMFAVTSLQAQVTALDAQINSLTQSKARVLEELAASSATVAKLITETPQE